MALRASPEERGEGGGTSAPSCLRLACHTSACYPEPPRHGFAEAARDPAACLPCRWCLDTHLARCFFFREDATGGQMYDRLLPVLFQEVLLKGLQVLISLWSTEKRSRLRKILDYLNLKDTHSYIFFCLYHFYVQWNRKVNGLFNRFDIKEYSRG